MMTKRFSAFKQSSRNPDGTGQITTTGYVDEMHPNIFIFINLTSKTRRTVRSFRTRIFYFRLNLNDDVIVNIIDCLCSSLPDIVNLHKNFQPRLSFLC